MLEPHVTFNYTTILNIVLLALAVILVYRFLQTGGPAMLRMMNQPAGHHGGMVHPKHPHQHG